MVPMALIWWIYFPCKKCKNENLSLNVNFWSITLKFFLWTPTTHEHEWLKGLSSIQKKCKNGTPYWLTRGVCTHNKQMHKHICKKHKRWSPGSSKHTELSWATRGVRKHTHKHISKKHTMCGLGSNKHTELRNTRQFDCTFSQTHEHKMKRNVTHSQTQKMWSWVNKALINPGC